MGKHHNIFIHSSAGEYLCCFYFFVITNNAVMCLLIHAVCLCVFLLVFLHVTTGSKIAGLCGTAIR